ncbi:MAG: nitroreductase [Rhodospirillaceae bacterium]|jgi:nitroreductase|nr:nitroreductase [Rhodospirillaceae bacterium]
MSVHTEPVSSAPATSVEEAITTRHSMRAFLSDPISKQEITEILEVSARAPSGTNSQPWMTYVLAGEAKAALSAGILKDFDTGGAGHQAEIPIYPEEFVEPYLGRRRKVGWDLYGLLGIEKGDKDKMHAQHAKNFRFFDAPIGLITTMHRGMPASNILDLGMYLENIMLAARAKGMHTCPQVAFTQYHKVIREHLPIDDDEIVMCGMSLGYADPDAVENTLVTDRAPLEDHAQFLGF